MSYDDKVRNEVQIEIGVHRQGAYSWQANDALNAIPPLTLKTEDGRFVKVEFAGLASEHGFIHPGVIAQDPDAYKDFETVGWWKVYRIVPEPQP